MHIASLLQLFSQEASSSPFTPWLTGPSPGYVSPMAMKSVSTEPQFLEHKSFHHVLKKPIHYVAFLTKTFIPNFIVKAKQWWRLFERKRSRIHCFICQKFTAEKGDNTMRSDEINPWTPSSWKRRRIWTQSRSRVNFIRLQGVFAFLSGEFLRYKTANISKNIGPFRLKQRSKRIISDTLFVSIVSVVRNGKKCSIVPH